MMTVATCSVEKRGREAFLLYSYSTHKIGNSYYVSTVNCQYTSRVIFTEAVDTDAWSHVEHVEP